MVFYGVIFRGKKPIYYYNGCVPVFVIARNLTSRLVRLIQEKGLSDSE